MIKRTIEGSLFREMLLTGAACLEKNKQAIDAMNVFPVPDGDTGTNMSMTMQRAVAEIRQVKSDSVEELASALSMGALRGAKKTNLTQDCLQMRSPWEQKRRTKPL